MLPKIAIVGRPNVGKSSLFNRIIGTRLSITDDMPGVTRDRIYAQGSWLTKQFFVIDTGGIEIKDAPFQVEIKAQVEVALEEADVIIFVVDCRSSVTDEDLYVAKMLYKTKKPVIVAVNKVDDNKFKDNLYDFYQLGFDALVPVSSIHSIGIGNLLDEVIKNFPKKENNDNLEGIKFSLVGRPNVGKSSLTNALLNENRVIVSDIAGTTRDSIDSTFTYEKEKYVVIDTAGLKKRGRIFENVDKFSAIRSIDAIIRSDVVLLVLDGSVDIQEQDLHIAQYIDEYNKPCIIVVNKWDLVTKDSNTMKKFEEEIRSTFKFLDYAPIVFLSAKENRRVNLIFPQIKLIKEASNRRVATSTLNDVLRDSVAMNPTYDFNGGKAKFYYISQVGVNPPTFCFFVNDEKFIHFSYKRYLENQIRKNFDFFGTPIKFEFRKRD